MGTTDEKDNKILTWQNDVLLKELASLKQNFATDSSRIRFINKSISYYVFVNFYLFVIYVLMGLIVMYIIFFKMPWSPTYKFMVLLGIALYPFVIISLEYSVRYLLTYMISMFTGSIHMDPYYEHQPFSMSNLFSFSSVV